MTMQELIERLEKAVGPDRALDWESHRVGGGLSERTLAIMEANVAHRKQSGVENCYFDSPKYTASIDAALSLFPKTLHGTALKMERNPPEFGNKWHVSYRHQYFGHAKELPIAIAISALRARLALASDGEKQ